MLIAVIIKLSSQDDPGSSLEELKDGVLFPKSLFNPLSWEQIRPFGLRSEQLLQKKKNRTDFTGDVLCGGGRAVLI